MSNILLLFDFFIKQSSMSYIDRCAPGSVVDAMHPIYQSRREIYQHMGVSIQRTIKIVKL